MIAPEIAETRKCKHHGNIPLNMWYCYAKKDSKYFAWRCKICNKEDGFKYRNITENREKKILTSRIYYKNNKEKWVSLYSPKRDRNKQKVSRRKTYEKMKNNVELHANTLRRAANYHTKIMTDMEDVYIKTLASRSLGKKHCEITQIEIEIYRYLLIIYRKKKGTIKK